jgi:hypothetical protein
MTTDDSLEVEVQGRMSTDATKWVVIEANWTLNPNPTDIASDPDVPSTPSQSWKCNPKNPGTAELVLSYSDGVHTIPNDIVPVNIARAAPSKVTFNIVTPPRQRFAGHPIQVEISIENKDGLVPGLYCFSIDSTGTTVKYWDPIGDGNKVNPANGAKLDPTISSPSGSSSIIIKGPTETIPCRSVSSVEKIPPQ